MKIAVYSAIFGSKDNLKDPVGYKGSNNIDYFLITDDKTINSSIYKIIYREPSLNDITKNARQYKILGLEEDFKKYDFIIWHDANLQMIHDEILLFDFSKFSEDIMFFRHSERNCVYDEAIKCIELKKDDPLKIFRQILGYWAIGLKSNNGLFDTSILVKNNRKLNVSFLKFWWTEVLNKSRRDQISLPVALKKYDIEFSFLSGYRNSNKYSLFSNHNYSQYNFLEKERKKGDIN